MRSSLNDIHDYEIHSLINKLLRFLGSKDVDKCLEKYQSSLKSSGPIFRDYYLKTRHPWWDTLEKFFKFEKSGKAIKNNLSEDLVRLAGDAKKILVLTKLMSDSVKQKYKKDLMDDQRAYDYLFELQIAWHFYLMGYNIEWYENDSIRHSEFLVKTPDHSFNVECKRISMDSSRKIRRRDFYRLAELIISGTPNHYGRIDIKIRDRLHGDNHFLNLLSSQIIEKIETEQLKGNFEIPLGHVKLDLETNRETKIDFDRAFSNLRE